jgi:hypothetical protein
LSRTPRRWRRWLIAGGAIVLIPLFFVLGGFGYFFGTAAHQRHEVVLPPPGLPDLAGDLSAAYGKYTEDGDLSVALIDPAFAAIRSQLEGVRVIFVPSWLSDSAVPSVALGNSLGYMAGIYNWLDDAGLVAEIADVETEDTVSANAARIAEIMARAQGPVCFVTHSKGGLDLLEYLRTAPVSDRDRVRCWIAMQAPFKGSPVADLAMDVAGLPEVANVLLQVLGGRGESLKDLTTWTRTDYLATHHAQVSQVMAQIDPVCLATYVADPGAFGKPTSWSYPALLWMHEAGVPNDGLVAVRSAVEICPRVLILEGLDHTGVVAPGVVAPIDQTALMKALLVLALQQTQTPKIIRE